MQYFKLYKLKQKYLFWNEFSVLFMEPEIKIHVYPYFN
jgi:hypothetical protein